MAEDYTTYAEVDGNSDLTVGATQIAFDTMQTDAVDHVTKDFGASYFGNFIHRFKFTVSDSNIGSSIPFLTLWGLTAGENFTTTAQSTAADGLLLYYRRPGADSLQFVLLDLDAPASDAFSGSYAQTSYWIEIERAGTTLTAKIYSDAFSTLIDTLTLTCTATTYRYAIACASNGAAGGPFPNSWITGTLEDLTLDVSASPISKVGGIAQASISKIIGITLANAAKIGGIST